MGIYGYPQTPISAHGAPRSKLWDPVATFEIINPDRNAFTCVGYARTQGRRCRISINQANQQEAYRLLNYIASLPPESEEVDKWLEEIACISLCMQYHRDQADDIANQWAEKLANPTKPFILNRTRTTRVFNGPHSSLYDHEAPSWRNRDWQTEERERKLYEKERELENRERELRERELAERFKELERKVEEMERLAQEMERKAKEQREREEREAREEEERQQREEAERKAKEERERQRKEEERKAKEEQERRRQEQEREARLKRAREQAQERERRAREKAEQERRAWQQAWHTYVSRWAAFKSASQNSQSQPSPSTLADARAQIPWPVKSGLFADVTEAAVHDFYRHACPDVGTDKMAKTMKLENLKWHPDKIKLLYQGGVVEPDAKDIEAVNVICRTVLKMKEP